MLHIRRESLFLKGFLYFEREVRLKSLSLENAIARHKGEAAEVEDRFEELSPAEKQRLFLFLSSL